MPSVHLESHGCCGYAYHSPPVMPSHHTGSRQALGDLMENVKEGGGCAGGHHTSFSCPFKKGGGQNTCCAGGIGGNNFLRNEKVVTYDSAQRMLFSCLQSMWDEGMVRPSIYLPSLFTLHPPKRGEVLSGNE